MDREPVSSSMIASIGYDAQSGTLEIEFSTNGQIWQYYDVAESLFYEFRGSSSQGKFFRSNILKQYREARVA